MMEKAVPIGLQQSLESKEGKKKIENFLKCENQFKIHNEHYNDHFFLVQQEQFLDSKKNKITDMI